MYVPVHRVPVYHDLAYDFASAKHTLVIVINNVINHRNTEGLDALSISPFLVIDDNLVYKESWGF